MRAGRPRPHHQRDLARRAGRRRPARSPTRPASTPRWPSASARSPTCAAPGSKGIDVSAVCPDGIWSPMLEDKLDDPDAAASFSGVMLTPEQVAERVEALLDSPRPVLTIPRWRGAFVRFFDAFPGLATRLIPLRDEGRAAPAGALQEEASSASRREPPTPHCAGPRRRRRSAPSLPTPRAGRCRSRPGCGYPAARLRARLGRDARAPLDRARGDRLAGTADPADWRVLELGSGRSTVWLARRAGSVLAFEDNEHWLERARELLARAGSRNVELRGLPVERFVPEVEALEDDAFDLVVVDFLESPRGRPGRRRCGSAATRCGPAATCCSTTPIGPATRRPSSCSRAGAGAASPASRTAGRRRVRDRRSSGRRQPLEMEEAPCGASSLASL